MSLIDEITADSPTHWWKLDSAPSGVISDSGVGAANNMTVVGSVTSSGGVDAGGGQRFDSGDYATGASSLDMPSGAQAFTLGGFFSPDAYSGDQIFFGFGGAATRAAAYLGMASGVLRCGFYDDDMLAVGVTSIAGSMIHLVATYDGNVTAQLYFNGAKVADKTFASPLNITASAPFAGRLGVSPFGREFTGSIAHLYILTGAVLSHARIAAHAAASTAAVIPVSRVLTSSLICPTINTAQAPGLHYPFHAQRI